MKKFKLYVLTIIALLCMNACGDKKEEIDGRAFTQEVTLPANESEQTVTITKLTTEIENIQNSAQWLTVIKQAYTSGSPQVKLSTTANTGKDERKCNVTITANSDDKVILTVTQQGKSDEDEEGTGIDDIHGTQTDKPAYSRRR